MRLQLYEHSKLNLRGSRNQCVPSALYMAQHRELFWTWPFSPGTAAVYRPISHMMEVVGNEGIFFPQFRIPFCSFVSLAQVNNKPPPRTQATRAQRRFVAGEYYPQQRNGENSPNLRITIFLSVAPGVCSVSEVPSLNHTSQIFSIAQLEICCKYW